MVKKYTEHLDDINSGSGYAVIIAGSSSDEPHIKKITDSLNEYGIPYNVTICSAHKQPNKLVEIIEQYNLLKGGSLVFIAVAGGTDALSGTLSYHSIFPVISCPPDGLNESCLKNPSGSSNAYIQRPDNVAKFIAQMYGCNHSKIRKKLEDKINSKITRLEEEDKKFK